MRKSLALSGKVGRWESGTVGKWDVHTKTTDDNDSLILAYLSLAYLLFIYLSFPFFASTMVGRVGLEPTANGLKGRCSTIELPTLYNPQA